MIDWEKFDPESHPDEFARSLSHRENAAKGGARKWREIAEKLAEALQFYADGRYFERPDFKNNLTQTEIIEDGNIAREAIAEYEAMKE